MFTTKIRQAVLAASAIAAVLPAIATAPTAAIAGDAMGGRYERYLEQEKQREATIIDRAQRFEARNEQRARVGTSEYDGKRESWERNDRGQHFHLDVPRSQEQHYRGR